MSNNKNKNTYSSDQTEEDLSARVVAIPKTGYPEETESGAETDPEGTLHEPGHSPAKEVRVVLSEPKSARQKVQSDNIGDLLREARLRRGDDLYQIAEYLCIKPAFLIALESSRFDEFPADAYVIGFLRTYANFLGIDGKDAVDRYRYEMAGRRKKPVLSMPIPMSEGRTPSVIVLIGAALAFILIYSLWYNLSSSDRDNIRIPPPLPTATQSSPSPVSDVTAGLTAPVPLAPVASAPTEAAVPTVPTPAPAAPEKSVNKEPPLPSVVVIPPASPGIVVTAEKQPSTAVTKEETVAKEGEIAVDEKKPQVFGEGDASTRIVIRATQNSWIMIADDSGRTLFDRVLKPGESYRVPNRGGLTLTTSNGSGIVLSLDGKDLPKISKGAPRMVRNIELDPNLLASGSGALSR